MYIKSYVNFFSFILLLLNVFDILKFSRIPSLTIRKLSPHFQLHFTHQGFSTYSSVIRYMQQSNFILEVAIFKKYVCSEGKGG